MSTRFLAKLGLNLKKYRLEKGLTQEEGGKNNPSTKMLYKITRALGIKLSDLFDFDK